MIRLIMLHGFISSFYEMMKYKIRKRHLWQCANRSKGSKGGKKKNRSVSMGSENGTAYVSAISTFVGNRTGVNAPKTLCIHATPSLCTRYNMQLHCDSAIIGTAASLRVIRICECIEPWLLTT